MITIDSLQGLANEKNAEYEKLSIEYPAGTHHTPRNEARDLRDKALECIAWMRARNLTEVTWVGPFGPPLPTKGEKVRVKPGAIIRGGPRNRPSSCVATRALTVTVYRIDKGGVYTIPEKIVRTPEVSWVGAGGCIRTTDMNNVEMLRQQTAA